MKKPLIDTELMPVAPAVKVRVTSFSSGALTRISLDTTSEDVPRRLPVKFNLSRTDPATGATLVPAVATEEMEVPARVPMLAERERVPASHRPAGIVMSVPLDEIVLATMSSERTALGYILELRPYEGKVP